MSCPPPRHNFASLPRATWRSRPGLGPGQTLRVEKRLHRDRADGLAIHLAEHGSNSPAVQTRQCRARLVAHRPSREGPSVVQRPQ